VAPQAFEIHNGDTDTLRACTDWADVATGNRISLSEWATTIITDHINTDVTPVPAGATPKGII
ncbi:hypothetical protein R6G99_00320, partial [Actinotignum timonense]|nr:hypothetical protein [Actinotignum timonense]